MKEPTGCLLNSHHLRACVTHIHLHRQRLLKNQTLIAVKFGPNFCRLHLRTHEHEHDIPYIRLKGIRNRFSVRDECSLLSVCPRAKKCNLEHRKIIIIIRTDDPGRFVYLMCAASIPWDKNKTNSKGEKCMLLLRSHARTLIIRPPLPT